MANTPSRRASFMVYGAYGLTGSLVVAEAVRLPFRVLDLGDREALGAAVQGVPGVALSTLDVLAGGGFAVRDSKSPRTSASRGARARSARSTASAGSPPRRSPRRSPRFTPRGTRR